MELEPNLTEHSEEYNTIMAFADDLEEIGVTLLSTEDMRKYAAAAEAYTVVSQMNFDGMNIEDL